LGYVAELPRACFRIGEVKVRNDELAEADDSRLNGVLSTSAARRRARTFRPPDLGLLPLPLAGA
jgi:hypothetical protein